MKLPLLFPVIAALAAGFCCASDETTEAEPRIVAVQSVGRANQPQVQNPNAPRIRLTYHLTRLNGKSLQPTLSSLLRKSIPSVAISSTINTVTIEATTEQHKEVVDIIAALEFPK